MRKELISKLIQKCRGLGKRGIAALLVFALLIGCICWDGLANTPASEEVLPMPEFQQFNILPAQIAEDTQYYKTYNHANDCHFEAIGSGGGYSRGKGYGISDLKFTGTFSVMYQTVTNNGGYSVMVKLGPVSGYNVFKNYTQKEQISMRLLYSKTLRLPSKYIYRTRQTEGIHKTSWVSMQSKGVSFESEGIFEIYDVLLVLADLNMPDNNKFSPEVIDDTPVIWVDCGEQLRPANYSITTGDLTNMKMKVTMVPKLSQAEENAVEVTFKATEFEGTDGRIGFTAISKAELIDIYGSEAQIPANVKSAEDIMDAQWRIIEVEDASTAKNYPLVTNLGETELTVPTPITDMAGNPVELADSLEFKGETKIYLDAVSPVAVSSVLSGSMIKTDASEEIAHADLFAGPGEEVSLSLKLSEKVSLVSGATNEDIVLKWNVKDASGNYITTKLKSIQTTDEVNVGRVSVLVFDSVVVEDGMQGTLTPRELIGSEYIVDASNNPLDANMDNAYPDRQIAIDCAGPSVSIGENVVAKVDTKTEKYYVFPIHISDGDDIDLMSGAGLLASDEQYVKQYFMVSSNEDVMNLKWQYAITSNSNDVAFGAEGNPVTKTEQYEQFAVASSGNYFLHLYLNAEEGAEIADSLNLNLDFVLADAKGNTTKVTAKTLSDMGLDGKAPLLVVTPQAVEITRDANDADVNDVRFTASIVASDLNGLSELVYQWVNVGDNPTENNWTNVTSGSMAEFTTSIDFSSGNPAETKVTKVLCVRAKDAAGNTVEYRSEDNVFVADVERVNARYEIVYDDDKAGGIRDVKIFKSLASDGSESGYTRVIVTMGATTYVRVFDSAAFTGDYEMLFDAQANEWYEVTIDETTGTYTTVSSEKSAIDWTQQYTQLTVDMAASAVDLTPVESALVVPTDDTTFQSGVSFEMIYTSARDDVHSILFNDVKDSNGVVIDTTYTSESGIEYYKINLDASGIKYGFTIKNTLLQSLGVADVDFANSYAVFLKADAEGNVTTETATDKISLMAGAQQSVAVPYKANGYETGVYALKVYLVQRDGGTQEFVLSPLFVVDNEALPEQSGVTGYDREVHAAEGLDERDILYLDEVAPDGSYLTSVDIGVAEETYTSEIIYLDGKPAFTRVVSNAIGGDRGVTVTLKAPIKGTNLLGETVGQVSGVRVWNQASKKGAEEVAWNTEGALYSVNVGDSYTKAELLINLLVGDMEDYSVVDAQTLANLDWNDFRVKMGHNVICYQLLLENGRISPVYTFEVNLYDEAPEVEVSYVMNNAFDITDYLYDDYYRYKILGTEYPRTYAQSYEFKIDKAYSEAGEISVYHAIHDTQNSWEYFKVDGSNSIPIEKENIYGFEGLQGTRPDYHAGEYDISHGISEFFMVIDAVGNAYSYYPIINNDESVADALRDEWGGLIFAKDEYGNEWAAGLDEDSEPVMTYFSTNRAIGNLSVTVNEPDEYGDGVSYELDFGQDYPLKNFDQLSIQVDDRSEVVLEDGWEVGINQAGIVYHDVIDSNTGNIHIVFPYDYSKAEGEMITHTVVLKGYINGEIATNVGGDEAIQTLTIEAPNVKPALVQDGTPDVGAAHVKANTYLFAESITDGYDCFFDMPLYANGNYTQGFYDIFGGYHELEVEITDMPTDPKVEISTTDITADAVEITMQSAGNGIFTINPETELPSAATVTGIGTSNLKIVMNDNGYFEVLCTYENSSEKTIVVDVSNIYNDPIVPEVKWSYSDYMVDPEDNSYTGEVTATLVDKNGSPLTDLETGLVPTYTFVPGGKTSHTFTNYVNIVGVVGAAFEVTLPITLKAPEVVIEDTYKPDVAVTGVAKFQNGNIVINGAYLSVDSTREDANNSVAMLPDYEATFGQNNIFDNMDAMLSQIALAERYIFTFDIGDESDVKIFVVQDKNAEAPDYSTGISDTIEGVSIIGRTLQISKNTEFVVHVVDRSNNATSIQFAVDNIGEKIPAPYVIQTLTKDGEKVRVYLTYPNLEGVTDLTITSAGGQIETDVNSNFNGLPYVEFTENYPDGVSIFYSYMYEGLLVEGSVIAYIAEFDNTLPEVKESKWSANYDTNKYTNQDITVQITLSKAIAEVYPVDAAGNRILVPEDVTIAFLENRVTVIYEKNTEPITLKVVDAVRDSLTNTIDLPEITTIDKTPAQLVVESEYSSNHRKAIVTVTADEAVTWPNGTVSTEYEFTVTDNGDYTISVSDRGTNISDISVSFNDIITEDLSIVLSTDGSDGTIIDPATYQVDTGDTLYIKVNRNSIVTLNGNTTGVNIRKDTWTAIVIEADAEGLYPTVQAVDEYGNIAMAQMLQVPIKDRTAPKILLNKNLISASLDASDAELEAIIRDNYIASDDVTAAGDLEFRYEIPSVSTAGTYAVTYYVEDEAGNVASATGWIRLYNGQEMRIEVNGERVERDETIIVSAGTQTITVVHNGEPYKVEWRKGLKSLGQMKNNANTLSDYTEATEKEMTLELTEAGYYTILLTTQGRDTYRIVIYVEE